MGIALCEALPQKKFTLNWRKIALIAFVANLPDFDFFVGMLYGEPNRFHRHFLSHSLGAAVVVGLLIALVFARSAQESFWLNFVVYFGVCFSHVLLDYFSADTAVPYGVPMFWPFTSEYFMSPLPIFMSIKKVNDSSFFQSLFVLHNILAALWELVICVPVLVATKMIKRRKLQLRIRTEG